MRLTLSTRNLSGIAARLKAGERGAGRNARVVIREMAEYAFSGAYADAPKDTTFMVNQLRLEYARDLLTFFLGFRAADFERAGLSPYFIFVLLGTRFKAANDFLTPNIRQARRKFRPKLDRAVVVGWSR